MLICRGLDGKPEAVILSQDSLTRSNAGLGAGLAQRFSDTGNPYLGFVNLQMIPLEAAHKLNVWVQHGDRSLQLEPCGPNETEVVRMIHMSSLAHILDIPKLQTAAMGLLSRHFDNVGTQPSLIILRAMWKATLPGCPSRELLLHNGTIFLNVLGPNT
jgi:hypothetical protein